MVKAFQAGKRVCRLTGLRDQDRCLTAVRRDLAEAVFGGDLNVDTQARDGLEPVTGDQSCVI